jgi:hypothetical protein
MQDKHFYTVGEISSRLRVPPWLARRAVDALGDDIPRAGRYRLIPAGLMGRLAAEIEKRRTAPRARKVGP